ncbi:MAG: efflux RND transporter periplasmic adaptor subunit, partial [Acidobacteriaceae bacterium]|nr:efflux RND transporter periplasmic adaptor subunit [Acidobacteriaceae bacterium]
MDSAPNTAASEAPSTDSASRPPKQTSRAKRWAIWIIGACLVAGGSVLLSQRSSSPNQNPANKSSSGSGSSRGRGAGGAIPVSVAKVQKGNMGVYIETLGTVTPVYTVTVASRVVGNLTAIYYKEGQMVHKGQLLALIDPRPYQATLTQAEGQLQRDQAALANAKTDLERYKMAFSQHAIPEQTVVTQQATVNQDEGTVKLDQGNLEAAKVNVEYTQIRSPIDGRVGLRQLDLGNIVPANGTTGIATITQLQPITVIFPMAEGYISQVVAQMRAGHKLRVDALDSFNETELAQGTVLTIDNQVDVNTGTVKVRATFANGDLRLFPNEFVNAKLLVRTLNNVNLIPTAAIQRNNDIAFVYVVNANSTVQSRNINIATMEGNTAAVTGLVQGEKLVTDGFDKLQDGV